MTKIGWHCSSTTASYSSWWFDLEMMITKNRWSFLLSSSKPYIVFQITLVRAWSNTDSFALDSKKISFLQSFPSINASNGDSNDRVKGCLACVLQKQGDMCLTLAITSNFKSDCRYEMLTRSQQLHSEALIADLTRYVVCAQEIACFLPTFWADLDDFKSCYLGRPSQIWS
jgi:hypothetical protein